MDTSLPTPARAGRTDDGAPIVAVLRAALVLLVLYALVVRLWPLTDWQQRLFWQHMSEDGYLMQTVARNLAIGLGMSTAEGTIPTNGVQPLATFAYAALHGLAGGAKAPAIAAVTIFSTAISALGAWAIYRLGRAVYAGVDGAAWISATAAVLWLAGLRIVRHTMNGLETGLYYAAIAAALTYYFRLDPARTRPLAWRERIGLGLWLGVCFLARNDAVFLIAALLVAHALLGGPVAGGGFAGRAVDALVAAAVSLVVASPWLVNNQLRFGSIVPVSGKAESHGVAIGANLSLVPTNLIESILLYVPIPKVFEGHAEVAALCTALLVAYVWAAVRFVAPLGVRARRLCLTAALFALLLSAYYGLFFGAPWFVSRYLSALTPLVAPIGIAALWIGLGRGLGERRRTTAVAALAAATLAIGTAYETRHLSGFPTNGHRQVVEWVQRHVDDATWVGAVQTGTLGFFHDRTINLDGKVNPGALRALQTEGQVLGYVVSRPEIAFLADWQGIAGWARDTTAPRFGAAFEVLVEDPAANLGVLHRRGAAAPK